MEAAIENRIRTHATIIIDPLNSNDRVPAILFEENYYVGSYSESDGLIFDAVIRLADGYGTDVHFSLAGGTLLITSLNNST